jgi:hypothetical protein
MTAKASKPTGVKSTPAPAPVASVDKTRRLQLIPDPSKTEERLFADVVSDGLASSASTAIRFVKQELGDVSLTELVASLRDQGEAVNRGDLAAAERMLSAQAVALNAVFAEMARRAALNIGEHLGAMESYMRLALKAQSQSRATVETLAAIKNPPAVFARQANINNGGQQQVNNGSRATTTTSSETSTRPSAHAEKSQSEPSKLLEANDVERLDAGTQSAASATHQDVETVGALNRPDDCGR